MRRCATDFEALLREALAPVEPPEDLVERLEGRCRRSPSWPQDELEAWELSAMRDPRNWVRPAAAIVAGGAAGTALVLLRARRRGQTTSGPLGVRVPALERGAAQRTLKDLARETRKLFGEL